MAASRFHLFPLSLLQLRPAIGKAAARRGKGGPGKRTPKQGASKRETARTALGLVAPEGKMYDGSELPAKPILVYPVPTSTTHAGIRLAICKRKEKGRG